MNNSSVIVKSSLVEMIDYDEKSKELIVKMRNTLYTYKDVSVKTAGRFAYAKSKGRFFNEEIKHKHRCSKDVTSPKFKG